MELAPITLFVYNRPNHTKKTVEALQKNSLAKESELFIFSDGPKNKEVIDKVLEVRNYIKTISGFKKVEIIERNENIGLANSIISGVTEIVNKYGKIIVLEDDLVTSPYFLSYMNNALVFYENEDKVISIHGYNYPVKKELPETFFLRGTDCWGWATWKRGWDLFEPDGKKLLKELENRNLIKELDLNGAYSFSGMLRRQIAGFNNSWAIRWHTSAFLKNKLTLYPGRSLVENIGQDRSGTHTNSEKIYKANMSENSIKIGNISIEENREARQAIIEYLFSLRPGIIARIKNSLKKSWIK